MYGGQVIKLLDLVRSAQIIVDVYLPHDNLNACMI